MKFIAQNIPDVFLIKPKLHQDNRGIFRRNFCQEELLKNNIDFVVKQGNISENFKQYTLRGFHYQSYPSQEAKIISCVTGKIYNVVLDIRQKSKTYKQWVIITISSKEKNSIYIPAGCANAFLTLENNTIVHYYMADLFKPDSYQGIRYNDPTFNFKWPHEPAVISEKDLNFPDFKG